MNYRVVLFTVGYALRFEAICFLLPLICAFVYNEPLKLMFSVCAVLCFGVGTLLCFKKPKNRTMYAKEGYITVALCWVVISIFGALPFIFSDYIPGFVDALFEVVSGFTTTGASVVSDVEAMPKSLIFWRSFTHWIGGMGIIVLVMAIFPTSSGRNMHIMRAEMPGPIVGKLVPTA